MRTFLRILQAPAAVVLTASQALAVNYIGDTQSLMSQCQYSGGQYGYVWTLLVSPSGKIYQDTTYLPTTTATGTHYSSKAFDEVGDWHFQQWSRMTQPSQNIKNQDQIMTVVAKTCTITVNVAPGSNYGSAGGGGTPNIGQSVTLSATAAAGGYKFDCWTQGASAASGGTVVSTNGRGTPSPSAVTYTFTATGNATYYANFTPPVYRKLTVTVNGGGTVNPPNGSSFLDGTTINPTATPNTGYSFAGWSGALSGGANSPALLMDTDKAITATFNVNYYNVAIATNGTGSGSIPGGGFYAYGTTPSFTATPATGSYFAGWSGAASGTTNPVGVYIDGNKSLTATFNAYVYTVSTATDPAGLTTVSGNGSYTYNQTATFTAPAVTGYTFTGWSGAGLSGTTNPIGLAVTADATVTANYTLNNYTLTTGVSGSGTVTVGGTYAYGTVRSITAAPGTGQHFTGWSGAATGTTNPINITIDSDKNLTAIFAPNRYTVTTATAGDGSGSVSGAADYSYGEGARMTATPSTGSYFAGWSGPITGTTNPQTFGVTADTTATATFTLNSYDIATATSPAGLGTVTGAGKYKHGSGANFTAPTVTGYTFTGWSGLGLSGTVNPVSVTVTANGTAVANYAINNYTLTTNTSGNGSVTAGGSFPYGTLCSIVATPGTGQQFIGWSGAASGSTNPLRVTMDGDKALTALFGPNQYTVTTATTGDGSGWVSGAARYSYGAAATMTAMPATGSHFVAWSGAISGSANPQGFSVTSDVTVNAEFALNAFDVSTMTSPRGLGEVKGAGRYTFGQKVTVSAPAVTGYTFTDWSGALSGSKNPDTLVVDGDKSATANYTINRHRLTTEAIGSGSVTEGGEFPYGTVLIITATPAPKNRFTGWSGSASGATSPLELTMDGDKAVTATFSPNVAAVSVASATHTYDGRPKPLVVTTTPAGLTCAITYEGAATPPVDAGDYRVVATIDDPVYQGTGNGTLCIVPAVPRLHWPTPDAITHPTALSERQLNATCDVPGTYTYSPAAGTVLNPGPAQALSVSFRPTDTRNFADSAAATLLDVNSAGQAVTVSPPSSIVAAGTVIKFAAGGGANGYVWGGAASGSGETQTVAFALPGGFEVTAYSPAGGVYARSNIASASVTVNPVPQAVVLSPATALAEPNRPITFTAAGGRNGYVWGGSANGTGETQTLSFSATGTYAVSAYSPAGGAFMRSNTATAQLTVAYAQTINFPPPGSFVLRAAGTNLVATASSGLPVRFTVVSGPGSVVGAKYLQFAALGAILVQADQDGDGNYSAAPSVRQTVYVNAPPVTTLQFPSSKTGLIHADHQDTNLALPQDK
jgi:uncharacterized repeat protein (TIGR02543 family)